MDRVLIVAGVLALIAIARAKFGDKLYERGVLLFFGTIIAGFVVLFLYARLTQ